MCAAINRALGMFVVQIIVVNLDVMVQTFIRENWGFLFNRSLDILTETSCRLLFYKSKGVEIYRLIIKPGK